MKQNRKSALLIGKAAKPVVEFLEQRQLLSATLSISSLVNNTMVFNAVEGSSSLTETLTLTDTGDANLTLGPGCATVGTARFTVTNETSIPASLTPGESFGLTLQYNATSVTTNTDTLSIVSNDPANPTTTVALSGIGTVGLGGSNQPSLATILQAYDIPTLVGEGPNDDMAAQDSVYPYPPDASSQEQVIQRFVKAGSGPVTINVLASFTAAGTDPYTLGTYSPSNPTQLSQLFTTPSSEYQSTYVQPKGATSFDPGSSIFGFYCLSNVQVEGRIIYSEDSLNTFDSTTGRHFRFFPMETPGGVAIPNEYIMTSTEWNAPIGYDFTNIVAIVSNVTAAPGSPGDPVMSLQNQNAVPGSNTLVFNRIQSPDVTLGDTVHNVDVLQINNTGDAPLIISSYTLSAGWTLPNAPTFPLTIAAGSDYDLSIQFTDTSEPSTPYNETNSPNYPSGGGVLDGSLVLNSNDPNTPTATVPLAGFWQLHDQNSNEPSLQTLVNLMFGWQTDINSTPIPDLNESTAIPSSPTYYGQEVVSSYWAEADTGADVTVREIAAWHTQGNTQESYWFAQGGSKIPLFDTGSDDGQTLFPYNGSSTTPAAASFSSTGTFGFQFDTESSVDSKNTQVDDDAGHHVRFYPVYSSTGVLVPNTYIAAMDYSNMGGQNFDFNDAVYLITNLKPVTSVSGIESPQTTAAPPAPADVTAVATSSGVSLQWAPVQDSSLASYNIYTSLAASSGFSLLASGVTATNYLDNTAPAGTVVYYQITAVDSNGSESLGTESGTTTLGTAPTGLVSTDIDAIPTGSTTIITPNVAYNVSAGGPGVTGTSDGFRFLFEQQTGDFDVKVEVSSITFAGNFATAGIMARSTLDADSANVYMSASPTNYRFKDRTTTGGTEGLVVGGTTAFPGTWVRLSRVGNLFDAYSSPDGVNWTLVSSVTLALPGRLYLGLAVASNETTATTTAQLADFSNTSSGPVTVPLSTTAVSGEATLLNVLSGDSDPTGTIDPTTVMITTPPNQGGQAVVNASTGMITYTSVPGFTGTETFSYTVADASATSDPTVVTVTVTPSPLVMVPLTFNVSTGQSLLANVLASDTDSTGTINPATLTITGDTADPNATVAVESGEISYTPNAGFTGTDTITYTVQDSNGVNSVPTTVTFIVATPGTVSPPTVNPAAATTPENQSVDIDVLAVDTSTDGLNPATVTVVTPPGHGSTQVNLSTGIVTYTPATNFSGTDTFSYTVQSDNGLVSQPATVTIDITPGSPVTLLPDPVAMSVTATPIATTGTATVNVISLATDDNGTLNIASVAITTNPTFGTATFNVATGTITYVPRAGCFGTDTLQYTVADVGGTVSAPATLTFGVGLTINTTTAKSLTYIDANGSKVRIALTGAGSALISFNGSGTYNNVAGPHGTGNLLATGNNLSIDGMQVTGTTITSTLTVTRVGKAMVSLGNITVTGELGRLLATTSNLTGTLSVTGAATLLELDSMNDATLTIGATDATRAGLTLSTGDVTGTSLVSAIPIRTLKATQWIESGATDAITAPSITSLVTTGNFDAALSLTGAAPYALQSLRVGGQISADAWTITGNTASVVVGSVAPGWTGNLTGLTRAFTIRTGGFAGTLTAGTLTSLSITGNDTGGINAASIGTMRVNGELEGGYIITTNGVTPRAYSLGHLVVTGKTINSTITSAGNIATISTGAISGSSIDAGVNNGVTLPAAATDFAANASISSINVTGRGATFSDSNIAASALGNLSLGEVLTTSSDTPFGIAADTIRAIAMTLDTGGGSLHLNAKTLLSADSIAAFVSLKHLTLNEFEIVPGL